MGSGERIISIAFREPPKSMFPDGSGVGTQGPDHLTFDLADSSKLSLSFYGKKPGPGMNLEKLSLQFALHETGQDADVLEAYERLIHDAMVGDHTLFNTAEGIERLWEVSTPLLEDPPAVQPYAKGSGVLRRSTTSSRHARGACRSSGGGARRDRPGKGASPHSLPTNGRRKMSRTGHACSSRSGSRCVGAPREAMTFVARVGSELVAAHHFGQHHPVRHSPDDVATVKAVSDFKAVAPFPDESAPDFDRGSYVQRSFCLPMWLNVSLVQRVRVSQPCSSPYHAVPECHLSVHVERAPQIHHLRAMTP